MSDSVWPHRHSPLDSLVPGILQARTLEWVAISFSNAWKWKVKVKSLSCVQLLVTPSTAAYQAPPSTGFSRQEYRSGVPLPSPIRRYLLVSLMVMLISFTLLRFLIKFSPTGLVSIDDSWLKQLLPWCQIGVFWLYHAIYICYLPFYFWKGLSHRPGTITPLLISYAPIKNKELKKRFSPLVSFFFFLLFLYYQCTY